MRVAYLVADPGVPVFGTKGASVHVQEIVRAFRSRGDEVTVYASRRGDRVPADLTGVRLIERRVTGADTAQRERGIQDAAQHLSDAILADGCDLVYERFSLFSAGGARVSETLGVPGVLEVNAPLVQEQRRHRELVDEAAAVAIAERALTSADVVACVSEPVAAWARAQGARHPLVAPNGVDTDRIRPPFRRRAADAAPTVGFVGTLKPWHGVDVLVDAVAELTRRGRRARLLVVGDGPERAGLERRAGALGVETEFTGAVAPEQIPDMLARMDIGAAPYRAHDDYFSPLKVYEYLAAGVPVVGSEVGQVPALVRHGRTGLITRPGDVDSLADALQTLIDDPAMHRRLADQARQQAVSEHGWSGVLAGILGALHPAVTS
ncbi:MULTISPECIES: glycosyltransferase family 4 protein [Microbacterium]|uniref:glycosyltransferase family 4 protein n=1 Tax=Microbacterium TaxID=33882 RepID=UPI002785EB34|nr:MULTISPECIES: glycosyltransferase family 4 protein [Microbacterium]MDQ1082190.1 starch synthase [Microbacterium sp. SORGH_AS_0344]MDQ1169039.1 starch synthase [Microbacterium proteolyticum]